MPTVGSENRFPKIRLVEGAAPATPASGEVHLYVKADGLLYWKDDAGTEYAVSTGGDVSVHLADTTAAHAASAVSADSTGYGNSAGDDVQEILDDFDAAITAGGGGTPAASGARVRNSAAINLNNGTITMLTFDTERWDDAAYHDGSTNTGRLTVGAGRYLVGGHVQITGTGGAVGYIAIRQGGSNFIAVQPFDLGQGERYASIVTAWECSGADYFELGVFIDAASKQALQAVSFTPEFWIDKIGS